jgi:hypothetical protein
MAMRFVKIKSVGDNWQYLPLWVTNKIVGIIVGILGAVI